MALFQHGTFKKKAQRIGLVLSGLYLLLLVLLAFGLRQIGEDHPILAALLYLPPGFYLAPTLAILGVVAWCRPKLIGFFLPSFLGLSLLLLQFNLCWNSSDKNDKPSLLELTVHSFNIGQSGDTSQEAFIRAHQPNLLAVQEVSAAGRLKLLRPPYTFYPYAVHIGEFSLFSQHPILERKILFGRSGPIAARCVVEVTGMPLCIYIVHLKSPRKALRDTMEWPWQHPISGNQETEMLFQFWNNQQQDAHDLALRYESEKLPCIVMGDTNAPPLGKIHRRLTQKFSDVHETLNWGTGFTFPGQSPFLLSGYGPWVRLDKVLINDRWKPISLEVEQKLPSQHRSLIARFALLPEASPSL